MGNKTRLEMQMQAYGQNLKTLRGMSREEKERYGLEGSPERLRWEAKVKAYEERRDYREKKIKEFDRDEPIFGSLRGLTSEEVQKITQIRQDWKRKRDAFMKDLNERYPSLAAEY